ncbi:MAG: nuclear transport factor 2 family protein [Pedobacter sp.]|nr:nuclear transport factor 2 family protein [Pedobacter sp.]
MTLLFLTFKTSGFCQNAQLNSTLERFRTALVNADLKTLENLTSDKLSYGHSNGLVENKKQFIEAFSNGTSKFTALTFTSQEVLEEDEVFVVRNIWNCKTHNKGAPPDEFNLAVLSIWKKNKSNEIILLARQAIKLK